MSERVSEYAWQPHVVKKIDIHAFEPRPAVAQPSERGWSEQAIAASIGEQRLPC